MKKILHIISQYPGKTGSGVYLNELIREAHKGGYRQSLVAAIDEEEYRNPYIDRDDLYLLKFNTDEVPFHIVGMSDEMPYRSKRYIDMTELEISIYKKAFKNKIEEAIKAFKPDMIFTHHLWLVTSMVKGIAPDIKIIALCHGTDIRQLEKAGDLRNEIIEGCRGLDLVLSLNNEQKDDIKRLYGIEDKIILVIGGGYNKDIFYPDFNKERARKRLVYAGKISYSKGLMSALRAISMIGEQYNFEFVLAGSGVGSQYSTILEYANSLNRKIVFLGEISQRAVGDLFRESDIFIMPSYYEGLSLVAIEALASGLLVVSSDIEGLISYLGDEINRSGIIEYVKLPKMNSLDSPCEDGLIDYEKDLSLSIGKQLDKLDKRDRIYKEIENEILGLSWSDIFKNIEDYIML